jgi:hypothetical protein
LEDLKNSWAGFDASSAECYDSGDKNKILDLISKGTGGIDTFNMKVAELLAKLESDFESVKRTSTQKSNLHTEAVTEDERRRIMLHAVELGGEAGALHIHRELHPYYWGISKDQLDEFLDHVMEAIEKNEITNFTAEHLPQYPQQKFDEIGPNAYQLTDQYIKLRTGANAPCPYVSYAVQQNLKSGLACSLFVSHAWAEAFFELHRTLDEAWPSRCEGAYICFLANPQNLDISALIQDPQNSPFYRVLECKPQVMLMAANSNAPIHGRLWCCLEAFCAVQFEVQVEIAGEPLWLVREDQRERANVALDRAMDAQRKGLEALQDGMRGMAIADNSLAELHACFESIAINVRDGACFNEDDRKLILDLIGDQVDSVNHMIKQQMVSKCDEVVGLLASTYVPQNSTPALSDPADARSSASATSTTAEVLGRTQDESVLTSVLPGSVPEALSTR